MGSRLPPELTDRIVDFVPDTTWGQSCHDTLLNCALTCKAWLPCSLFHLYRDLYLNSEKSLNGLVRAAEVSNIAVALRTTRTLTVDVPYGDSYADSKKLSVGARSALLWTQRVPVCIPAVCPNIMHLQLDGFLFSLGGSNPDHLIQGFQQWKNTTHLTLSSVKFRSFGQFQRLVRAFSALESLNMRSVFGIDSGGSSNNTLAATRASARDPALRALYLSDSQSLIWVTPWLLSGATRTTLRRLQVHLTRTNEKQAQECITATGHRLEHLLLSFFEAYTEAKLTGLNITRCTALQSLGIYLCAKDGMVFTSVLGLLSLRCRLQSLSLRIEVISTQAWAALLEVLGRQQYSQLREVTFDFFIKQDDRMGFEQGSDQTRFQDVVSALQKRGVVVQCVFRC